jgi:uncharacterized protein (DUF305 family)
MLAALLAAGIGITTATAQDEGHGGHAGAASPESGPMPMQGGGMMGDSPMMQGKMPHGMDGGPSMGAMRRCMEMMAEGDHPDMPMMPGMMGGSDSGNGAAAAGPLDPVEGAFDAINRRMHRDMTVAAGLSPDEAFATSMVAHHEAAVDMARVVLAFGEDPEIRKLAETVIATQEAEVALMKKWLEQQGQ